MGEFPILLTAAAVVAFILLAPRLRSALRSGFRSGVQGDIVGRLRSALRNGFRGGRTHHRGIDVESDLLSACGGDRGTMERLIRYELDRKPELERTGAALMALSRLRADRR
ncbi:MAG: hypothetical protein F4181_03335 [Proteobacteria bacterium]|nr:hypothetical protein [Pseudomonadota bacterium]MYK31857.1 hypothetical protein [Boseongicola sp. SB0670_bin_30]